MHEVNVVATELARNIKLWASRRRVRIALASGLSLVLVLLIFHRFSPKTAYVDCAFRIPDAALGPETQGDAYRLDNCVQLEVATTNSARTLGLSGRKSMGKDRGMVFDFGVPSEYCMWMKDMNFSLDMLWLNDNKEIVYMIEGVSPDTYPKSFCGADTARYIVEVNSGIIKAADLHVGQRLKF